MILVLVYSRPFRSTRTTIAAGKEMRLRAPESSVREAQCLCTVLYRGVTRSEGREGANGDGDGDRDGDGAEQETGQEVREQR